MTRSDRRGAQRVRADWPVTLEAFDGRVGAGRVVDVSTGGMRVHTDADFTEGTAVTARVNLPRSVERLEVVARVVRRASGELALDFIGLPRAEAQRLLPEAEASEPRRRSPRVVLSLPGVLEGSFGGREPVEVADLSTFGAKVTVARSLRPGDQVVLELAPEEGEALRLPAVVWEVNARGTALMFINLPQLVYGRLALYMKKLLARGD